MSAFLIDASLPRATGNVIRAHGPDTLTFLQGQLSQDVDTMALDESRWSLLLEPTGKVTMNSFAANSQSSGGGYFIYLLMALFFVALYFLMIRPQQKRRRAVESMQAAMGPGDEIVTVGGLYGTIQEIDNDARKRAFRNL